MKQFHQRIIDERREYLKNRNNNNNDEKDEKDSNEPGYSIFIDHILNNEGMFTDADIQDHVITLLSAGNFIDIEIGIKDLNGFNHVIIPLA